MVAIYQFNQILYTGVRIYSRKLMSQHLDLDISWPSLMSMPIMRLSWTYCEVWDFALCWVLGWLGDKEQVRTVHLLCCWMKFTQKVSDLHSIMSLNTISLLLIAASIDFIDIILLLLYFCLFSFIDNWVCMVALIL